MPPVLRQLLVALLPLAAIACSVLVTPGDDLCASDEGCPTGQRCNPDGLCEPDLCGTVEICGNGVDDDCDGDVDINGPPETCDTLDNDCDGLFDEDVVSPEVCNDFDDDCDGFVDEELGGQLDRCGNEFDEDCDGIIDEGAPEVCDTLDNDCDGTPDNGATCPDGQVCSERNGCQPRSCLNEIECEAGEFCDTTVVPPACEPRTGAGCTTRSECPAGDRCSTVLGGICVTTVPTGTTCMGDFECGDDDSCTDLAAVELGAGRICSRTCCGKSECPDGTRCRTTRLGAALCVPAGMAGNDDGEACANDGQCASGRCLGDRCAQYCTADSACGDGERCVGVPDGDEGERYFTCGTASGTRDDHADCGVFAVVEGTRRLVNLNHDVCRSGMCTIVGRDLAECISPCVGPCEDSEGECGWAGPGGYVSNVCYPEEGRMPASSPCTSDFECQSGTCYEGACRAGCCGAACPNGEECRAVQQSLTAFVSIWPTLCIPAEPR